jgi:hypothetical protein
LQAFGAARQPAALRNLPPRERYVQEDAMIRWTMLAMLLAALQRPEPLHAQDVLVGDRVRVTPEARGPRIEGPVVATDDSTIVVRERRGGEPVRLAYTDVYRIERYEGRASSGRGALRGAGVGLAIGAAAGGLATGVVYANERDERCGRSGSGGICYADGFSATGITAYLGLLLTVTTTTVGAAVGAFVPPERWRRVSVPRRLGLAPFDASGRPGIGFVARF